MLYTYYGDDFTGSTDVLEQLGSNAIPAVLFTRTPTPADLAAFPGVQAIGIAGDARSRSPEWMSANLPAIFRALQQLGAPITHYKTCSTFDSSPTIGSIGRAIQIGAGIFQPSFVPIVVGAPHLRRYVAFGNLFAAAPDGSIQRIDRHPMAHHPVTPMHEADLRLHLAAQGCPNVALIDIPTLHSGNASAALDTLLRRSSDPSQRVPHSSPPHRDTGSPTSGVGSLGLGGWGPRPILFDTVDTLTQSAVGNLLWTRAQHAPLFAAGSSGFTAALVAAWHSLGLFRAPLPTRPHPSAGPLLVVSGSCSAVTERQIRYALTHNYEGIALDPHALVNNSHSAFTRAVDQTTAALASGRNTVLYTALGTPANPAHGEALGIALGNLLRELLTRTAHQPNPVRRAVVCGGDTSSHAVQQLGIHALTWAANIQPGGPLCRAHAENPTLDGLELVLKGGQVGTEDFFDLVRST